MHLAIHHAEHDRKKSIQLNRLHTYDRVMHWNAMFQTQHKRITCLINYVTCIKESHGIDLENYEWPVEMKIELTKWFCFLKNAIKWRAKRKIPLFNCNFRNDCNSFLPCLLFTLQFRFLCFFFASPQNICVMLTQLDTHG